MDFFLQLLIFFSEKSSKLGLFLIENNVFQFLLVWVQYDDKNKQNATSKKMHH